MTDQRQIKYALRVAAGCLVVAGLLAVPALRNHGAAPGGGPGPVVLTPAPLEGGGKPPDLDGLRRQVSFPLFIPTRVPAGLVVVPSVLPDEPGRPLHLRYQAPNDEVGLLVTLGPAGCCLDADMPRKRGEVIPIRGGLEGHFLITQPRFGGNILWWNEAGVYIALSGPTLTKADLVEIADSMVSTGARPEGIPGLEQVKATRVNLGLPTTLDQAPQPLRPEEPRDRAVIAKLLSWLSVAEVAEGEIGPPGRTPTLVFELREGGTVAVQAAYDCTTTRRENGTEMRCGWVEGQVVLHAGERKPVRIRAPELTAWLAAGWEQDVRRPSSQPLPDQADQHQPVVEWGNRV